MNKYVAIYKEQLKKGDILITYNKLVKFVMNLRKRNSLKRFQTNIRLLEFFMDI
ncbi:MAG: DUF7000 family protein [Aestuariibaculum sp.]